MPPSSATPDPPRRLPRRERERQMLAAGRAHFTSRGFLEATMDEIAAAVGVTKPMLFRYFGSKEGLFEACVAEVTGELIAAVEQAAGEGPPEVRLWRGLLAVFAWIDDNREGWSLLYPPADARAGPFAPALTRARAAMAEVLARWLTATAEEQHIDPEVARIGMPIGYLLFAATEAAVEWWLAHPEEPRDLHALRLMSVAWQGLERLYKGDLWIPPAGT